MQGVNPTDYMGIDISDYEAGIVYQDIVNRGKKIVYLKATEGSTLTDASFRTFNASIRALGVKTGAYHFAHFYTASTIPAQVENFLNQIKGQTLDCALVFDCEQEGWHDNLSAAAVTAQALDFAQRVKAATGVKVIFYSNTAFIQEHLTADIRQLEAWIADTRYPDAPGENGMISAWLGFQYSFEGNVGGKTVDLDRFTQGIVLPQPYTHGVPPAPSEDETVRAYQHKLNVVKIRDNNGQALAEDGLDGPKTKQAVVRLENLMLLSVDAGIWGPQCEGAYAQLTGAKPQIRQGSTGKFVRYLQYRLDGGLAIDGIFGVKTVAAVKAYQSAHGLAADGIVGTLTWSSLMR